MEPRGLGELRGQRSDLGEAKAPRISGTPHYRQISRDLGKGLWLPPDLPVVKTDCPHPRKAP